MKSLTNLLTFQLLVLLAILLLIHPETGQGQSEPAFVSDDFSASELDPEIWEFIDPLGDATLTMNGAQAIISVPAGTSHDIWIAGNQAPRIMQPAQNTDFEIEVKFESAVTKAYQMQGVFVEQDQSRFLRFDFHSDGLFTKIFSASFSNGYPNVKSINNIANGVPLYMRVKREGDQWTQSYSYDGKNWSAVESFTEVLSVASVGAFVGNAGTRLPQHNGVIDYFFNTAAPIVPEDQDHYTVTVNVAGDGKVTKNPEKSFYSLGEEVELTAIAGSGVNFSGWGGDLSGRNNQAKLTVAGDHIVKATFVAPSTIASDDFNSFDLNTNLWTFIDPVGDAILKMTGTRLAITVPAGTSHNVWRTGNLAPRIMQRANDTDFEIEVKFDSEVKQEFQMQGMLIEQDNNNFLRFDFHSDGSTTRIFAASFAEGSPSIQHNSEIPGGLPLYMRVQREGDQWLQSYSHDGNNWVISDTLIYGINVTAAGVFVGNAETQAPAPMHTGIIDYFINTAAPILDRTAPVIGNIQVTPSDSSATITWTTNERATSRVAYGPSDAYENGSVEDRTLATEHTIKLTGLASGTLYHCQISSIDSSGNAARSPDLTFSTTGPTSSVEVIEGAPTRFELRQNYPNPFNPTTTIELALSMPGFVTLKVFTMNGEEAAQVVAKELAARRYKIEWNATGFPSGVYFYRFSVRPFGSAQSFTETRRLLLLK
jgi:regulation of enolase protein 1 (concanavalin A-like superfamily)